MKKLIKFLQYSVLAIALLAMSGVAYADLTSPTGGSGLTTPGDFCLVSPGVWQFCNTSDVLGDNLNPIANGEFTALFTKMHVSGMV